jgi:threonine dehydrogenase-like Zn-dependent dehydrogenase
MGPYGGGQAEYLRVPHGDFNCLKLPEDAVEKQNDYVMLSDVFPQDITQLNWCKARRFSCYLWRRSSWAYGSTRLALKASKVMVVDSHPDRLKLKNCAIPIDFSKGSAVEQVLELPKAWVLIRVANA